MAPLNVERTLTYPTEVGLANDPTQHARLRLCKIDRGHGEYAFLLCVCRAMLKGCGGEADGWKRCDSVEVEQARKIKSEVGK